MNSLTIRRAESWSGRQFWSTGDCPLGLMMIGLAKKGAGTWDIALNVDIS